MHPTSGRFILSRRALIALMLPFALLVVPFLLLPIALGVGLSFTNYRPFQADLLWVGLDNYGRVLNSDLFRTALPNGLIFTALSVTGSLIVGVGLAAALRRPFRGRRLLRIALLLPYLLSPAASGVMWHQLLNERTGLLNIIPALFGLPRIINPLNPAGAILAVILTEIWRKFPLVTFLVLPGIESIPSERWDQAHMDGLNALGRLRQVVLPSLSGLLLAVTLLLIGDGLGMAESVFFLTGGGPGTQTMTPGLFSYRKVSLAQNWTQGAIAGWLIAASVLAVSLIMSRLNRRAPTDI
ncbi:MAG: sugar ABC transporter permease [Chloroflexota bacterium]|nr:sugar ABC transporter permease [Chloroflexota bacterium]